MAAGKESAMQERRQSLKTYDQLSLDLYRQQLVDAVR